MPHRHPDTATTQVRSRTEAAVLAGRTEIGLVDPTLFTDQSEGPRRLLLAGRSWRVTHVDWNRRRCYVEAVDGGGKAKWSSGGGMGLSFALVCAMREVVLGADPPARLTKRALVALADLREACADQVMPEMTVITRIGRESRWWTWAGLRTDRTLAASMSAVSRIIDDRSAADDRWFRLLPDVTVQEWSDVIAVVAHSELFLPVVDPAAIHGLKFSAALPEALARTTLAARTADLEGAKAVLAAATRFAG